MLRSAKRWLRGRLDRLLAPYLESAAATARVDKGVQVLLGLRYAELVRLRAPLPSFDAVGFRCYSQNEEDGILLFLFSLVGTTNKRCVEIGAGDGVECNTANLVINHGWTALLVDGDPANVARGTAFYARCPDTWVFPPRFVHSWVTAETVDRLIASHGFAGEIDLLSIDIDGNDYWVWKAIESARPRVVVIECHNIWPADRAVTVPYRPDFDKLAVHPDYSGASLAALVKLGRSKGYRLVGANRYGFNAFFVRDGLAEELLPEVSAESCLRHPQALAGQRTRRLEVEGFEWLEL